MECARARVDGHRLAGAQYSANSRSKPATSSPSAKCPLSRTRPSAASISGLMLGVVRADRRAESQRHLAAEPHQRAGRCHRLGCCLKQRTTRSPAMTVVIGVRPCAMQSTKWAAAASSASRIASWGDHISPVRYPTQHLVRVLCPGVHRDAAVVHLHLALVSRSSKTTIRRLPLSNVRRTFTGASHWRGCAQSAFGRSTSSCRRCSQADGVRGEAGGRHGNGRQSSTKSMIDSRARRDPTGP